MHAFFKDQGRQFAVEGLLGSVWHRAAEVGEILTTIDRVPNHKPAAWAREWLATADRVSGLARTAEAEGHTRSAAARWLRAASYYSEAADSSADTATFGRVWERHRTAWDRWVDLTTVDVERVEIPYEDTTLPGYLFRSGPGPRRTLVFVNGSDGPTSGVWARAAADGLERGWNVLTFDGPGQNAALVRQGIPFRADWENVLTPVVDWLVGRADTDDSRLAVMGISQGGYWVPRALTKEHRFAAAIADPGVVDVATTALGQLPHMLVTVLESGDKEKFDKEMGWGVRLSPGLATTLGWRMRPYGTTSYFDFYRAIAEHRVTREAAAEIRTPLLVTDPEDEQFWPGQSARLAEALTCPVTLVSFTAEEGADGHCEPAAPGLRGERIFDWLDATVPA